MSKHTPGKWEIKHSQSNDAFNVVGTVLGGKYKIARCPYVTIGHDMVDERNRKEAYANARLIAAAPEMYEALCKMVILFDAVAQGHREPSYVASARTLLAALTK